MKKTNNENNNTAQIKALVEVSVPKVSELKYGKDESEVVVRVYPVLPFAKRSEMVREIVDGVFMGGKDSVKTYAPEFLSFLQKFAVIEHYTDLKLPTKLDDMWLVLNYTPIYDDVVNIIGEREIKDIFDAANNSIETYRQYLTTKTDIGGFMNKISGMLSDFGGKIPQEDIKEITSKIKSMAKGSSLQDMIGALIGNKVVQG